MLSTSARLLRLATLLQSRRHWPGAALSEQLGVDARTVRRDVDRLRELGYPVEASSGVGGGYALGRGADLPPLVLDDEEAVALAIALRAAGATVGGIEATSLQLLGKLDQLMPTRLRRRATALHAVTMSLRGGMPPLVDAGLLTDIATACRDARVLRFGYRSHAGDGSERHVQPTRLANYGRRWYLIAWDVDRGDWRSFRVDRMNEVRVTGDSFVPRPVPADVATRLERGIAYEPFACRITLRLAGSVAELQAVLPVWCGVLEPKTATHSLLHVGAESPEHLLAQVLMIGQDVELVDGEAMAPELRKVLSRMGALFAVEPAAPE